MSVDLTTWLADLPLGTVCATLGLPQTGKSWAMKAADARGAFPRRVVFDHLARRDRLIYASGLKDNPTPPWSGTWCTTADLCAQPRALLCHPRVRVVVTPVRRGAEQLGQECSDVMSILYAVGGVDLLTEEFGRYSRRIGEWLDEISSAGGHALMRLFLINQSFARVHVDARRNVNAVVAFAQSGEDLAELRTKCGPEFAALVQSLRPGDAPITWRQGGAVERATTE